ncbi:hypothetical protein LOTGIDRAFT_154857 [Lottia gigantea]|uniref:Uncharacterized protein n=1 Tax=Lottia gigantea TaxID=225164 RepID=V4B932_LOTGI|nr:hypothetical protein LOTGIDRAFT_154857 [Lottia gigantea]ESO85364.1 hypothetical protein LOTGIDRAFT_154857 [Lottia gigantea]
MDTDNPGNNNASVTFQDFIRSLISAADDRERMGPLRSALLGMVGNYRDCIVACEHQFSKRGSPQLADDHIEVHSRLSILYLVLIKNEYGNTYESLLRFLNRVHNSTFD